MVVGAADHIAELQVAVVQRNTVEVIDQCLQLGAAQSYVEVDSLEHALQDFGVALLKCPQSLVECTPQRLALVVDDLGPTRTVRHPKDAGLIRDPFQKKHCGDDLAVLRRVHPAAQNVAWLSKRARSS